MNAACHRFRGRLAEALSGDQPAWGLAMHEHLLACAACRELLAEEEALDTLLSNWPHPRIPAELARRLLSRLAPEREGARLEALLGHVEIAPAPGLSARVLAGLAEARREERLERWLERVPAPVVPLGLAQRVLAAVARERTEPARPRGALLRFGWYTLAATLLLGLGALAWLWTRERASSALPRDEIARAQPVPDPSPELLASLDVLENLELLSDEEVDLLLGDIQEQEADLLQWYPASASSGTPSGDASAPKSTAPKGAAPKGKG